MRRDAFGFIIIIILCFLFLLVALPSTSSLLCHPDHRHALLRFKQSLSITGPIVASWMEDEDCCSWDGIACDNSTGNVIGLDLTSAGLQGSINSSSPLFLLRHLRGLSLQGNDLLGSKVPPEIGVFAQLTSLNLSYSNISGILPTEISQLSKIVSLDFSDNFWLEMQDHTMRMLVSNLTQLEELDLGYVNLSMVNPTSFMNLSSSLISLKLSECLLGGKFPEFIFGLPNLQVIDTWWNYQLTGTFPKSKWSPSLDYLSLYGCSFSGAVPKSIGNLSRLTCLDLGRNNFTGAVPNSIGNLSRLTYLDLEGNNFTGAVPNSIGNLSRLIFLDLSGNNFTIDLGILSTLEDLQFLYLFGLSVFGEDANHGFSLPKLQDLYMESCNMSKFPSFLSRSKELRSLFLVENRIPEIPSWLWRIGIDTLEELYLFDNLIKGSIPPSICQLTSLSSIELSGNYLRGIIPQCLGNLTKLQKLYLSNNSLSGPLPTSLANCTSLRFLDVSYNNINGAPSTWLSTSSISHINLQANNFVGQWPPDVFLRSAFFDFIDLSDNKFEGPLPVPNAKTFYYSVSNNLFSGSISSLLCNATDLYVLDLSNNSLTGVLPDCLEDVTGGLVILNLRANKFQGQISEIFHEGSTLTSLDLSGNQFEGPLPRSLSHCKQLEVLDVGNNKIEDSFPNWLGDLPLKVLCLRSNHFHGRVITFKENHSFPMARIMDLSHNSFDGNLQDEFIIEMFGMTRDNNYDFGKQYLRSYFLGEYYSAMFGLTRDNNYNFGKQYLLSNNDAVEYYSVMIDLKGIEMEMGKIYVHFAMLDLSSNHFHGEIPKNIGLLKSLKGLNFSHNLFTGSIPPSVGNLTNLESLDLSSNHLIGEIPKELVKLTSLGFLDLSWNNFTGPIPFGGQVDTFSNSSFKGNPGLCGIPLTRSCDQRNKKAQPPWEGKDDGKKEGGGWTVWEYVALGFGSGMGMGISLGYMVLEMGRPLWLVQVVIRLEASYRKMSKRKKGDQRRNGRR